MWKKIEKGKSRVIPFLKEHQETKDENATLPDSTFTGALFSPTSVREIYVIIRAKIAMRVPDISRCDFVF